ncbi:ABC transporter permease [Cerasibacillus sp. JNUCC 74]
MKALITYQLRDYLKSYNYVAPFSVFIIMLIVNYAFYPNPVLASYGVTAIYLYILTAWVTVTFFHTEDSIQEGITIIHTGSENKFFVSKYLSLLFITIVFAVISVVYPVVFGMFSEQVTIESLTIGFLTHLLLGVLAISIGALFTRNIVETKSNQWLGIILVLVVSISSLGIQQLLPPSWEYLLLLIPPISEVIVQMNDSLNVNDILIMYGWSIGYSSCLIILFFIIYQRKKRYK